MPKEVKLPATSSRTIADVDKAGSRTGDVRLESCVENCALDEGTCRRSGGA
jgi:hypothetical protein